MELTQLTSSTNAVLKRTDATFSIAYEGATPSRHAIVEAVHKKHKGLVIVRHVYTQSGAQAATAHVSIYGDEKIAHVVEQAKLISKQQKAAPAAEAAAE
jgi:ribosomal protein S24E